MRRPTPKIVRNNGSQTSKFRIEGLRVNGKRTRKFFGTRREAEAWLRKTLARVAKEGQGAIHMPEQLRVDAVECAEKLKPYGKTLRDATDHYLAHLASIARSCTISALVEELIAAKKQDGASDKYLKDLRSRLDAFSAVHGERMAAEVSTGMIDDWLRGLGLSSVSRNNSRRVLAVLFAYGVTRGYCMTNPATKAAKAKVVAAPPAIFTPEQMRALLEHAPSTFVPFLVLGGFAGLRSSEIDRLDWADIDLAGKLIHLPATKTKTGKPRFVTVSDNLAAWLAPLAKKAGAVTEPEHIRRSWREQTCKAAKVEWQDNGLRHSFASYHLAHVSVVPGAS